MGDPFRDQLVEELESYLGHRLMEPERIHMNDLRDILACVSEIGEKSYQEGYENGEEASREADEVEGLVDDPKEVNR